MGFTSMNILDKFYRVYKTKYELYVMYVNKTTYDNMVSSVNMFIKQSGSLKYDITLERDKDGNDITVHSKLQNRLYRKVDMNEESTYQIFSPPIRDTSLFNGLNNILMRIEDVCELARGTIADVNAEARTATEITVLKQKALENTLKDVVYIMDVYTTLYELAPEGDYDVSFEWDDSIQVDKESEMNKRLALVNAGISNKVEFRMWYFGETEEQAIQALAKGQSYNNYEMMNSAEMQQETQ